MDIFEIIKDFLYLYKKSIIFLVTEQKNIAEMLFI